MVSIIIRCNLLNSYIKPQLCALLLPFIAVVIYWIPTSNHNTLHSQLMKHVLKFIEFLHQTTTKVNPHVVDNRCNLLNSYIKPQPWCRHWFPQRRCNLLNSYIKPQLSGARYSLFPGCNLLNSYIKPQLVDACGKVGGVVIYWIPTSNHNHIWRIRTTLPL